MGRWNREKRTQPLANNELNNLKPHISSKIDPFWKIGCLIYRLVFLTTTHDGVHDLGQVLARWLRLRLGQCGSRWTIPKNTFWPDWSDFGHRPNRFGHHWPDWKDFATTVDQTVVHIICQREQTRCPDHWPDRTEPRLDRFRDHWPHGTDPRPDH